MANTILTTWAYPAVRQNLTVFQGDDFLLSASPASGQSPTSLSGASIGFSMRDVLGGTLYLTEAAVITTSASGLYTVTVGSAGTTAVEPGDYQYDISRTDAGNSAVHTIGVLTILPQVRSSVG